MAIKTFILLSVLFNVLLGQTPVPPNAQQYLLISGNAKDAPRTQVTTNYVDRLAGLFRLDVVNEGRLTGQILYYASEKVSYVINHAGDSPVCTKTTENYADTLEGWQTSSYAGKTKAISQPNLECNVWNKTVQSWTWSYLASVKDNKPVEVLGDGNLFWAFNNFTVGPAVVPKEIFKLSVSESSCK